jgi:hypothetical protein
MQKFFSGFAALGKCPGAEGDKDGAGHGLLTAAIIFTQKWL